jgi:hypothetical protein
MGTGEKSFCFFFQKSRCLALLASGLEATAFGFIFYLGANAVKLPLARNWTDVNLSGLNKP